MKKSVKNKKSIKKEKTLNRVNKNIPVGVKILSIIGYIFSILLLVVGILSWIVSIGLSKSHEPIILPSDFPVEFVSLFTNYLIPLLIVMGFVFIIFGIIGIFVSRGLWKGRNWARILLIVFSIFGIISSLTNIIAGDYYSIISLAIDVLIIWYLLASKEVQKYFR